MAKQSYLVLVIFVITGFVADIRANAILVILHVVVVVVLLLLLLLLFSFADNLSCIHQCGAAPLLSTPEAEHVPFPVGLVRDRNLTSGGQGRDR